MSIIGDVTKLTRLEIRLPEEQKQEFQKICDSKNLNGSAVIRSFIDRFIEENKVEYKSFNLPEMVHKLSKGANLIEACKECAPKLGYGDEWGELLENIVEQLVSVAKSEGTLYSGGYGEATLTGNKVYFVLTDNQVEWYNQEPDWWSEVARK